MPLEKARTLQEVHYLFDPSRALDDGELEAFYVDRKSETRDEIEAYLYDDITYQKPVHLLFTGHRGSGKSTEINKLCSELNGQFFIVNVSFRERRDVDYVDVILKAANSLFKAATEEEIIKNAPAQIAEKFWDMLGDFIKDKIFGANNPPSETSDAFKISSISAGGKINYLAGEFEAKFEIEPDSRAHFKENSKSLLAEIINKINMLSDEIRKVYGSPVLFIFEDADKLDLEYAEEIFYRHSNTLATIRASAIYVIDISLRYNAQFSDTKASFSGDSCLCLPNIKLITRQSEEIEANYRLLEQFIDSRAETYLFSTEAKRLLITYSGGLIRSLIALVQRAARRANIKKIPQIEAVHVEHAINHMRGDFIAVLNPDYYAMLHDKHFSKELDNTSDTQYLLRSLSLLEYENGEIWCDVHPIILPEVEKRTALSMPQ